MRATRLRSSEEICSSAESLPAILATVTLRRKRSSLAREMRGAVTFADQFVDQHEDFFARTFGDRLHYRFERRRGGGTDQAANRIER